MLRIFRVPDARSGRLLPVGILALGVFLLGLTGSALAQDDNLEDLLQQVGEDYAIAYTSPFLYAFGPNQNSAMYQTAEIPWHRITFGIGIKAMAAHLNEDDQNFRKVLRNVDISDYISGVPGGTIGDVVLSGPTIFGNTEQKGKAVGYVSGIPVYEQETIPGLIETRFVPLATPEAYVGGIAGLKLTLRYFPEIDLGDYGKTKYFGWGLQWNANGVLKNLPLDLMVGFFDQQLKVGTLLDTNARTYFAGASKDFGMITPYGGFALEESDMKVAYVETVSGTDINFKVDGLQDSRITLGATLNLGVKLNVEAAFGNKITNYSAGLMFGL